MERSPETDVIIAGAGIIGLSVGLELRRRGASVMILERDCAMRAASWAAGGMLAARDTENPPALLPLSLRSVDLYPEYLEQVERASGQRVPVRTRRALEQVHGPDPNASSVSAAEIRSFIPGFADTGESFRWLEEESLDPRDLCRALPAAFVACGGILRERAAVVGVEDRGSSIAVRTARERFHAAHFVNCFGAWASDFSAGELPVEPVKGQAATVALAPERMGCVLRTPEFYAIPRGDGRVTVGATVEHAGFDLTVNQSCIDDLLRTAGALVPELERAQVIEAWAGLRPGTPDGLPILGASSLRNCWHATGHYRNGILLAPVTARVMAQLILQEQPEIPLDDFAPRRFAPRRLNALSRPATPSVT